MKEKGGRNWFRFMFRDTGYQFPGMISSVLTVGAIVALMVLINEHFHLLKLSIPSFFHTVLGLVTGLLLVFRTNTAYDRWWEGRKQIGIMLNTCRAMAFKLQAYLPDNLPEKLLVKQLIIAYPWAVKNHLRQGDYSQSGQFLPSTMEAAFLKAEHKPNYIMTQITLLTTHFFREKFIVAEQLVLMENDINVLVNVLGGCERIRNTPMPMGYGLHLKRILLLYLITLPITFINDLKWWSVPVVMIVFYTMVGIELIGEEIEEPFGEDPNDLPMDSIQTRIGSNVNEIVK
jgi:ion channel-forming bestrophin family protein